MRPKAGTAWRAVLLAAGLVLTSGCTGSHNPGYFPWLLPTGEMVRTHAKPPGRGAYANFDPYACRLEVRPKEGSNPVGSQHVIIATIYDGENKPRRSRRIEWMLEGAGHIIEVDESGWGDDRGGKIDNKYAVSYTSFKEHTVTRGNDDPRDDFVIRPGQTWCVVSSAVEGDSHITCYAPEIFNWNNHKVTVTKHWINAGWTIPVPATNRVGSQHVFVTNIYRFTDRQPLANYRVRYTILDGPPAVFLPNQQRVTEVISDLQGNAGATIAQVQPAAGINRIGVEIIRPPDPCCPTGPGIIIGRGETVKEWVAPAISLTKTMPPTAAVGQPFNATLTLTNTGRIETDAVTVRETVPEGVVLVNSTPPANVEGQELVWTIGTLRPGQTTNIQTTFRGDRVGTITNRATARTVEGLTAEATATTTIAAPGLNVTKTGPAAATVGAPIRYQITVTNPGNGPATNVMLTDSFDAGLQHSSGANPVRLELGTLAPGETRPVTLDLVATQTGTLVNRVTATADGGLTAQAQHPVTVQQPRMDMTKTGPPFRFAGGQVEWTITVTNSGEVPLTNVVVRDQLPREVTFVSASTGGQVGGGQVVWNVGTVPAREQRTVTVTARADQIAPRAVNVAEASADPNLRIRREAEMEIRGAPALQFEVVDTRDDLVVGDQTTYEIVVTSTGSLPASEVEVRAAVPAQLEIVRIDVPPGSGPAQPAGGQITFPKVATLLPGQKLSYRVVVKALEAGDHRFRAELRSTALSQPVVEFESTIVKPRTPGAAPMPPAPPPG